VNEIQLGKRVRSRGEREKRDPRWFGHGQVDSASPTKWQDKYIYIYIFAMAWRRGVSEKSGECGKPENEQSITFILMIENPYYDPGQKNARTRKSGPGFATMRWLECAKRARRAGVRGHEDKQRRRQCVTVNLLAIKILTVTTKSAITEDSARTGESELGARMRERRE
jgi:hypothetical protein